MTEMIFDNNGTPIPALTMREGGAHSVAFSATAANNSTAFKTDTVIVSIFATTACFIKLSDTSGDAATTSDHYFPAGIYYDISLGGRPSEGYGQKKPNKKYISAIQEGASGTLYISEKE